VLVHKKIGGRKLKKMVAEYILAGDFAKGLSEISSLPPRQVVNPLFSFLCSIDELLKWRAVTAMGKVVSTLAASDLESARVVMRRLIWNLNDESGGIGWGCPESMAEAMARNKKLAAEYACILISYIQPDGNYLEHEGLQRGVLWGVGRLAHSRPQCMQAATEFLLSYMKSEVPHLRGLAAWAVSPILNAAAIHCLRKLTRDPAELMLYRNETIAPYSVGHLAGEALAQIE